jgi:hypothetical protein
MLRSRRSDKGRGRWPKFTLHHKQSSGAHPALWPHQWVDLGRRGLSSASLNPADVGTGRTPLLLACDEHGAAGMPGNVRGMRAKQTILELRPMTSHDDEIGARLLGNSEDRGIDIRFDDSDDLVRETVWRGASDLRGDPAFQFPSEPLPADRYRGRLPGLERAPDDRQNMKLSIERAGERDRGSEGLLPRRFVTPIDGDQNVLIHFHTLAGGTGALLSGY